jgi:para-aminobenzoate synthetase component 1
MYHEPMPLPLVRELPWRDPVACFARLRAAFPQGAVFLDSALKQPGVGRYSSIAVDPVGSLRARGRRLWRDGRPVAGGDPFDALEGILSAWRQPTLPDLPPFQGGAAGWLGYDLGQLLERLPSPRDPRRRFDDLALGLYDTVLSFDLDQQRCWLVAGGRPLEGIRERTAQARRRMDDWESLLRAVATGQDAERGQDGDGDGDAAPLAIRANFSPEAYQRAVRQVIDAILAGDIFQANLSQCFSARLPSGDSPWQLYRRLRARNPAPFAAYLEWGSQVLASASPERFLRLDPEGRVETRPIKGTRPRGAMPDQDARLAAELLASAKDRSENVMIVDLLRNDLSRVCRDHSVTVPQLCGLESYRTVHHLVSVVCGRLREGQGAVDLLRAAFPGGSVTGAPKIRAMEIIAELEPTRRGPYCGAVAWLGFDGAMDSSIVIRSFTVKGRAVTFQAGGGIVADSEPAAEYAETLAKAAALMDALGGRLRPADDVGAGR